MSQTHTVHNIILYTEYVQVDKVYILEVPYSGRQRVDRVVTKSKTPPKSSFVKAMGGVDSGKKCPYPQFWDRSQVISVSGLEA